MASGEGDVIAVSNDWNESLSLVNGTCSGEWNDTDCDSNFLRHSDVVTAVYCVAYSIVFVVGLVGNFFVISVVCRAPRMKTVTNLFIANLAVADILVILLVLPGTLLSAIFVPWILGDLMCKLVAYISGVSVVASVYSLLAVTADRFFAICYPMKFQVTKRRARVILVFTWILALTVTSPWLIYFQQVPAYSDRNDTLLCVEQWPHPDDGNAYFLVANLFFCYIFPITVILFCYITIFLRVFNRAIPSDTKDSHMERIQQRSKVRVIKMLVVIIVIFALSWLPLYIIFCRVKLFPLSDNEQEILAIAAPVSQWLGLSNSCINPIVYAFFNDKFRKGFIAIIKSRSCWSRLRLEQSIRTNTMAIETTTVRYTASRASRKVSFAGESAQML